MLGFQTAKRKERTNWTSVSFLGIRRIRRRAATSRVMELLKCLGTKGVLSNGFVSVVCGWIWFTFVFFITGLLNGGRSSCFSVVSCSGLEIIVEDVEVFGGNGDSVGADETTGGFN